MYRRIEKEVSTIINSFTLHPSGSMYCIRLCYVFIMIPKNQKLFCNKILQKTHIYTPEIHCSLHNTYQIKLYKPITFIGVGEFDARSRNKLFESRRWRYSITQFSIENIITTLLTNNFTTNKQKELNV